MLNKLRVVNPLRGFCAIEDVVSGEELLSWARNEKKMKCTVYKAFDFCKGCGLGLIPYEKDYCLSCSRKNSLQKD